MDHGLEVSDPTDWTETSLPTFGPVDAALRCQVCKDFFTNAVITTCAHTFCSLCIRRCLAAEGRCPSCRANEQDVRLRRNVAAQEMTDAFVIARPEALKLARQGPLIEEPEESQKHGRRQKRKREMKEDSSERAPRRSRRLHDNGKSSQVEEIVIGDSAEEDEDTEDPAFTEEPPDGLVPCPICHKRMKAEAVFSHLDVCEGSIPSNTSNRRPPPTSTAPRNQTTTSHRQLPAEPKPPPERLPQLNYSLLKDTALRKKLSELGISSSGPKTLLIRRHTEWINLWNANCDSARPRTRRELLSELDSWERSQGGRAIDGGQGSGMAKEVMRKDFDGDGWAKKNKEDFDQLIADARKKRVVPTATNKIEAEAEKESTKQESEAQPPSRRGSTTIAYNNRIYPAGTLPNTSTTTQPPDPSYPPSIFSPSGHLHHLSFTSESSSNAAPTPERTTPSIFSPSSLTPLATDMSSRPGPSKSPVPGFSFEKSLHHRLESGIDSEVPMIPDLPSRSAPTPTPVPGFSFAKSQHHLHENENGPEPTAPNLVNPNGLPNSHEENGQGGSDGPGFVPPTLRRASESESSLPGRLASPEGVVRKRPMFEVPGNPVEDSEMGGTK